MRILHTSDWHLGRQLSGHSLESDHQSILDQVYEAIEEHLPQALIIAGDVFDRASPPATAVGMFNRFVRRVREGIDTAVIVIAGNHDSGERVDAMSMLADEGRTLVRGTLLAEERVLYVHDEHGPVAITALPFGTEYIARSIYDNTSISYPADVMAAQVAAARSVVPEDTRWIIVAHAFVANTKPSESERQLVVGGLETVPHTVFDGANYVALGHLHRPQQAGAPHIAYSGSPLAFGFDESDADKSMRLVDIDKDGDTQTTLIPFQPVRKVRRVQGRFEDLLATAAAEPSEDFIQLILTDDRGLLDPMPRIREFYPYALDLRFVSQERELTAEDLSRALETKSPIDMIRTFLEDIRETSPDDDEVSYVEEKLNELANEEASQ